MSELKALWIPTRSGNSLHCYLKAEADQVIAELKEQVREERSAKVDYKISARDLSNGLRKAIAEIRHHKYQRCLAKAERCKAEQTYSSFAIYITDHPKSRWANKSVPVGAWFTFWKNREQRWLELAEKFKEYR